MKITTKILFCLVVCISVFLGGLFLGKQPAFAKAYEKSVIESVMERGVLRVGFSTFVPWAMQNKNGEYVGFEIDVAKKLAEDLGVELQLVPTNWDGIIPALLAKKFDVIIGGLGVTTKRNLTVNFSIPYDYTTFGIMANKEKAGNLKSLADFKKRCCYCCAKRFLRSYVCEKISFRCNDQNF